MVQPGGIHRPSTPVLATKYWKLPSMSVPICFHLYFLSDSPPFRTLTVLCLICRLRGIKLERVFRSQRKGEFIKITEDQIRALNESKTESWPFGLSNEPYNLLENSPSHSNEHGQLHEATGNDCEMLQDLNVDVSIANISEVISLLSFFALLYAPL